MNTFVMSQIIYTIRDIKGGDIVDNGYMQEKHNRILSLEDGTVMVSFDYEDTATIRQGLQQYRKIMKTLR